MKEYKIITRADSYSAHGIEVEIVCEINELANDGWELVGPAQRTINQHGVSYTTATMQREKKK